MLRHAHAGRVDCSVDYRDDVLELRVTDDGRGGTAHAGRRPRPRRHARAGGALRGIGRGRTGRPAASPCTPSCPFPAREPVPSRRGPRRTPGDPGAARRRPDDGARRVPPDPLRGAGHRRGRARRPTASRRSRRPAGCGPTSRSWTSGCPGSTASRRPRRLAGDGAAGHAGRRPDHVRRRLARLRRPARRGQRLPAEERAARGAGAGDPAGRRRRCAARPGGDPAGDRGVRPQPGARAGPAGGRRAHRAGARGAAPGRAAGCPTPRSPRPSSSARRR